MINNFFFSAAIRNSQWQGRKCCIHTFTYQCQSSCHAATTKQDVIENCDQMNEQNLFACLDKQEIGENCCGSARSAECLQKCKKLFIRRQAPKERDINRALRACKGRHPMISECIKNLSSTEVDVEINLRQCRSIEYPLTCLINISLILCLINRSTML